MGFDSKLIHWELSQVARDVSKKLDTLTESLEAFEVSIQNATVGDRLEPPSYFADARHVLIAANDFVRLFKSHPDDLIPTLTNQELETIYFLRNLWEHRDEKRLQPGGKWFESKKANAEWLTQNYGENWIIAFSVTHDADGAIKIGSLLQLTSLRMECEQWLTDL